MSTGSGARGKSFESYESWGLALRLARRELRGGLGGFRILVACLALGVASIAAIGSLSSSMQAGIDRDARAILGGDVELRLTHRPATEEQLSWLGNEGQVSLAMALRSMARAPESDGDDDRALVEIKAVDNLYPLAESISFTPEASLADALAKRDGRHGALIAPELQDRLGVQVGETLKIGSQSLEVRGVITREPDQAVGFAVFGPRVLMTGEALSESGLIQEGSLIRYHYRIALPEGTDVAQWIEGLKSEFRNAAWRIRSLHNASPGLARFMDRVTQFMRLVGLTALLIGGIGIANAVRAYLERRAPTIATLKCLGASGSLVFRVYALEIGIVASIGILAGLVIGALSPLAAQALASTIFPFDIPFGIHALPLGIAAAFGLLVTALFTVWPLGKARDIQAGHLFRALVAPPAGLPRRPYLMATLFVGLGISALTIAADTHKLIAIWFLLGSSGAFVLLLAAAALAKSVSRWFRDTRKPSMRLALANLHRPGAPTTNIVLSLGLGLSVLVAVNLIHDNLTTQLQNRIPDEAPSYFFIDIQPHQNQPFTEIVESHPGVTSYEKTPMVRGKIVAIDGTPADEVSVAPEAEWVVRGDRGLTWSAKPPEGSKIIAGEWWAESGSPEPLISMGEEIARGLGVGIGDTITFNILGREITARIVNLRRIDWATMGMNFVFVFAPGTLDAAPHSVISTVYTSDDAAERSIRKQVTDTFSNVSAIRVRDALDQAWGILDAVSGAVLATASITLVAGILVLGGSILNDQQSRLFDSTVFKVLGASRRRIAGIYMLEYGLLGLMTAVIAAVLGTLSAWAVITFLMQAEFTFAPELAAGTAALGALLTIAFGIFSTWRALAVPAARLLRVD